MIRPGSRPAARAATHSRAALVAVAVASTVALAGCAAGQVAQTASQANSATGATVTVNGIAIRDAQIAFPDSTVGAQTAAVYRAGGTAPVEMHVINQSTQADRLVSASSPVAVTPVTPSRPRRRIASLRLMMPSARSSATSSARYR